MKDRIKTIMESQHMTQQTFASFIEVSPATLSGIFTGRTKPSLNIVEAIKNKFPNISTDWLLFGNEPMFVTGDADQKSSSDGKTTSSEVLSSSSTGEGMINFDLPSPTPPAPSAAPQTVQKEVVKYVDKPSRKITEIRIFYDDQTWESFLPKK